MDAMTDRRSLMTSLAGFGALAGLAGAAGVAAQAGPDKAPVAVDALGRVPWPYRPLDPDAVAERAFAVFQKGFCMLGVFEPIVRGVAERLGPPYTAFPFSMFSYGAGGVMGWGTLCGTLNGAAAAFALLSAQPGPLTAALFTRYEREALPDFVPHAARFASSPAVPGSVLCHASVSRWCTTSGKRFASPERFERCGALAGSVARKAVTLLNAQAEGRLAVPAPDQATASCLGCHAGRGEVGNASGRMSCSPCHTPAELAAREHPKT
jgi:hypothetical protein